MANAAIPNTVDAEIIFTRAPFVQYEQILLDKKFRHLKTNGFKNNFENGCSKNTKTKNL